MRNRLCIGILILIIPALPALVTAQDDQACVPQCRSGYICHAAKCISRCNPTCSPGTQCTEDGECQPIRAGHTSPSTAPSLGNRFGIQAGFVMPGEIYAEPPDIYLDTESGWILRATADSLITQKFSVGGYLNYISAEATYGSLSSDFSVVGIGVTMKLNFELNRRMNVRAGLGIGYQMTEAGDVGAYGEEITGVDLAPITELVLRGESDLTYLLSIAGFSQPAGGNEDADVTWSPILFISGGVQFGGSSSAH